MFASMDTYPTCQLGLGDPNSRDAADDSHSVKCFWYAKEKSMIGVTKPTFALAALLLLRLTSYPGPQSAASVVEQKGRGPARYYIITKARLQTPELVYLFGASNLPTGSVLVVNVYDHIGQGSRTLNEETRATVREDGLFEARVQPKANLQLSTNQVCTVVFEANDPTQPKNVIRVVGRRGKLLGTTGDNPQFESNSTGTGGLLVDTTVVTE